MASYVEKIARLQAEIAAAPAGASARVGLAKSTSNLFRDRAPRSTPRIDLKHFNRVVAFDPHAQTVDAEGMTTYAELVAATLRERGDALRRAAIEVDHRRRRHGRSRHRGNVVSAWVGPRYGRRAGSSDRRRPHRHLQAGQRAPRPVLRLSQFVWHAGLRTEADDADAAGRKVRARRAQPILRRRRLLCGDRRSRRASRTSTFSTALSLPPTKWSCRSGGSSTKRRMSATTASSASTTARCASARPTS